MNEVLYWPTVDGRRDYQCARHLTGVYDKRGDVVWSLDCAHGLLATLPEGWRFLVTLREVLGENMRRVGRRPSPRGRCSNLLC